MPPRVQLLAIFGLATCVLVGLGVRALRVNDEQVVEVDESALARARSLHQRATARASSPSAMAPTSKRRTEPATVDSQTPAIATRDTFRAMKADPPGIPQPGPTLAKGVTLSPGTKEFVAAMDDANKAYDRGDYMGAVEAAEALIEKQPNNVRMLRVVVSSHCILGNAEEASGFFEKLPARDQRQMARRCGRYGIELEAE